MGIDTAQEMSMNLKPEEKINMVIPLKRVRFEKLKKVP